MTDQSFVQLSRRFRELDEKDALEHVAFESYLKVFSSLRGPGWEEILALPIAVILGEPGSGKTWELRDQSRRFQANGSFSLFIRLDRLVTNSLDQVLERSDAMAVAKWRSSKTRLTLFLDSVDEAKFARPSDFSTALDAVRKYVGDYSFERLQLIVSSRISEWRPVIDATILEEKFPTLSAAAKSTAKPNEGKVKVFQIQPLDREQVGVLVASKLRNAPAAFLRALDENFAWEFARRPIDVSDLVEFWKQHQRLGCLSELIDYQIRLALRESPEREAGDTLDMSRARKGAQALAAAVIFCRNFNFKVPDSAAPSTGAMDAMACLGDDWSAKQSGSLLARALFDSPSYGRIRFHHRRIAEFLAAEWLSERIGEGFPLVDLESLLFEFRDGQHVLRPSLAPIAAWLAVKNGGWISRLRELILDAEPELYFRVGDPSSLPVEYRRKLLEAFCQRARSGRGAWTDMEDEALGRLAAPELSDYISSYIRDHTQPDHVRILMLKMVRHGRLTNCVDTAIDVLDEPTAGNIKLYAFSAIRDLATLTHLRRLATIVSGMQEAPPELGVHLSTLLFPALFTTNELASLLGKINPEEARSSAYHWYLKDHFEKSLSPEAAGDVLRVLVRLLETPPLSAPDNVHSAFSLRYSWFRKVVPVVLLRLLEKESLLPEDIISFQKSLRLLSPWHDGDTDRDDGNAVNLASVKQPVLRQNIFWSNIEAEAADDEFINFHRGFDFRQPLRMEHADWEWAVSDIRDKTSVTGRLQAFSYSLQLWILRGRKVQEFLWLYRYTNNDRACRAALYRYVANWPRSFILGLYGRLRINDITRSYWWRRKWLRLKDHYYLIRARWLFWWNLGKIRNAEAGGWLCDLVINADSEMRGADLSVQDWEPLQRKFGRAVADATKEGCINFWRKHRPPLPSERKNSLPNILFAGLTGLRLEFERAMPSFPQFSRTEAIQAARYAVNELNHFPPWLAQLAKSHPEEVVLVLKECVDDEWALPAEFKNPHFILARLRRDNEPFAALVGDHVLELLKAGLPANREIENSAYSLLLGESSICLSGFGEYVADRLDAISSIAGDDLVLLIVSLQVSADVALDKLEQPDVSKNLVEKLCQALVDPNDSPVRLVPEPDYLRPEALVRLIHVAYKHIRTQDDEPSPVGPFTPGVRHDAERFRTNLLSRLANNDSVEAGRYLENLSQESDLAAHKEWLLALIDERMRRLSEPTPWLPKDIETFRKEFECDPRIDRDLCRIVSKRIRDIKNNVEKADNSLRSELQSDCREADFRRWLARKLQEKARGRYTVPQESVIDQEQRPDIRIENPVAGYVSIEVKLADNWTVAQLSAGLRDQLVGKYLRAHDSHCGLYVLACMEKQEWIHPVTSARLTFEEVVKIVAEEAEQMQKSSQTTHLSVVGIDFRIPQRG